jgi:hypothetical protein
MVSTFSTSAKRTSRSSGSSSSRRTRALPEKAILLVLSFALIAPAVLAALDPQGPQKAPYVLITTDGHSIDVTEKPEGRTDRVLIHLAPAGQAAFYPAKMIDWAATEKFNAPLPVPVSPSAGAKPGAETPSFTPVQGATVTRNGKVLELKLIGNGHFKASTATESGAGDEGASAQGASGSKPPDPNAAAGLLASLAREMADLKGVQKGLLASKASLEDQLAQLQAKAANAPPQGLSDYQSPTQKAIDQAKEQIQAVEERLAPIERRIADIRAKAIDLGGSAD